MKGVTTRVSYTVVNAFVVMHGVMPGRSTSTPSQARALWAAHDSSLLPTIHRLVHRLVGWLVVPFANASPPHT